MENQEENFDYIKVDVARLSHTDIYLKVPKNWNPNRNRKLLGQAAYETTKDYDWDSFGWENNLEVNGWSVVKKEESERYLVFDATSL